MRPWQSFRRKYPLLLFALVCGAVAANSVSAYLRMSEVLRRVEIERLTRASGELAHMLTASMERVERTAQRIADDERVSALALHGAREQSFVLEEMLAGDSMIQAIDLRDRAGRLISSAGNARLLRLQGGVRPLGVGPLFMIDSTVLLPVSAAVMREAAETLGVLTAYRRIARSERLVELIGTGGQLLIGNADGSLWSDFAALVPGPPDALDGEVTRIRGTRQVIGVMRAVPQSPWLIAVQTPRRTVLAPARRFLLDQLWINLLIVALAALGVWLVSRRMTTPLTDLVRATSDMADGTYSRRVRTDRADELGVLASAFNHMAERVETTTTSLARHARQLEVVNAELLAGEGRLLASERHFRALIEHASDMVCVLAPDGQHVYASPAHQRFIGFTAGELVGRLAWDFIHPDDLADVQAAFARVLRGPGERATARFRYRHKEGAWRHFSATATNLLFDPAVHGIVVNSTDITDQLALEEQLVHSMKMQAVGQLAGGVAHDFNNLLTVISSYSGLLLDELSPQQQMYADIAEIQRAAERAATLTRQLLAFSRRQVLQPRVIQLNELVPELGSMLGRLLPPTVELRPELDGDLGYVNADPGQLEQVIVNLVVNARDAMPEGGTIGITTHNMDILPAPVPHEHEVPAGSYVTLTVSDTGAGMDAATRARLFEPFFTTKEPGKGTGLGLATVYGIVSQSGGYVLVESEPGRGSAFRLMLPRFAAPDVAHGGAFAPASVAARGRGRLLLIDDEHEVRQVVRRVLERAGYVVHVAASPGEALELWAAHAESIDLVVTDLMMPEMNGRQLVQRLREDSPELRAVFISGYTDEYACPGGQHDDASAFLHKPFTPDQLVETVREALEHYPSTPRGVLVR